MNQENETNKNNDNEHIIDINNKKDFEILEEIPSLNEYIKIYKVLRKIDNNYYILIQYPLDIIAKTANDFKKLEKILEKIKILLSKINNKNILNIKESFIEKSNQSVIMILELYENKNLQKNVLAKYKLMRERYIPENILLNYLYDIADGINALHGNNLFNIDISPSNIIIDNNNNIKLNPYICLDNLSSDNSLHNSNDNHFKVQAPELMKNNNNYTKKSDVWYFGLLIYELSQLKPINKFYYNNIDNIYNYIIKGQYTLNSYYSKDIKDLIKLCLQYSPNRRPNFEQILKIIDLSKKNKALNEKMKKIKLDNRKGKFFRKIDLKSEIDKFNKTLYKLKNYETSKNIKYKIHLNQTPTLNRNRRTNSNFNINININNKTFNKINLTNNNSNENMIKNRFKLNKCIYDRKNKINLKIPGKNLFPKKNNEYNNIPHYIKLNKNKTLKKIQRPNNKLPLIINITDNNNKKQLNKSTNKINKTYYFDGFKKNDNNNNYYYYYYKNKEKISYFNTKTINNKNRNNNLKRKNLSKSFSSSKLRVKKKV